MSQQDELRSRLDALGPADLELGLRAFRDQLGAAEAAYLQSCVRCGLCADACHYFRSDGELESVPGHKLGVVAAVFKRHFTTVGALAPRLVGAQSFDRAMAEAWIEAVFGRCSLCGRCSLNCTTGIHIPAVLRAARAALVAMGLAPADLLATVTTSLQSGNSMGIDTADWLDTVQWIEAELRGAVADPAARIPVDQPGARVLLTVNPREPKFFPLTLLASATVLHAAKEDWTLASEGWDLTNYGLFLGEAQRAGAIAARMLESMDRLRCRVLAIGECGHGFAAARWEAAEWLRRAHPFPICSVLEIIDEYLDQGRIQVDPDRHPQRVTLHDPCNLVRLGGVEQPQRSILRRCVRDFVEMTPHGVENFCCGGGGGQLAMGRYKSKRLHAGRVKADQIRRTGARIVVAPCHNCIDQLMELNTEYGLGITIKTVAEIVADALVLSPRANP